MKKGFFRLFWAVLALAVFGCLVAYFGGYGAILAGSVVCGLIAPENRNK